jgi:hypothetical protein
VDHADLAVADDDGVLFVPAARTHDIFTLAETISSTEQRQADRIRASASEEQILTGKESTDLGAVPPATTSPSSPCLACSASESRGHWSSIEDLQAR